MAYGGTINPILGTESGVSLLIGYRLDITTLKIDNIDEKKSCFAW